MKRYFYDLINNEPFAKPIHDLKYQRIQPKIYPLSDNRDIAMASHSKAQWQIKQLKASSVILEHLILPKGHNISEYRNTDSGDDWQKYQRPQHWFECTPLMPSSAISQLYVGFHGKGQISLLALIKAGVKQKVCLQLSGDKDLVDSPSTPNGFVYNFAPQAGHDKRARASLMLAINNEHACQRLQSFISGISQLAPFDEQMMNFYQQILANCGQLLMNAEHDWQLPQMSLAIDESIKPFVGYPNHIADPVVKKNFTYYKADILNFPTATPPLHLAICHFDYCAARVLIEADPMVIFKRDAFGTLPIELATSLYAIDIAAEIFMAWFNLPQKQQWADDVFISCASLIDDKETKPYIKSDYVYKQLLLKQHSQYHYLIGPSFDENINYWQNLRVLASDGDSPQLAAELSKIIPDNFQLFQALLTGDMTKLQASLLDQLPNITMLSRAIKNLDWPEIERFANEPWLRENQHFQRSVRDKDIETIKEINRQVPKTIPKKLPDQYRWQQQLKQSILEKLTDECDNISRVQTLVLEIIGDVTGLYQSIEALDIDAVQAKRSLLRSLGLDYFYKVRGLHEPWQLINFNQEIFNNINCPKHLPLIIYYLQGDMASLLQYIDKTMSQLKATPALTMLPQRPALHQSIIDGHMPNIDAFIEEQHFFNKFISGLQQLFTEQYNILLHHFRRQYQTLKQWQQQKVDQEKIDNSWQKN